MSTTPSAMSERAPGLNYDPASGTPYIPPEGAATTPPPITAPPQRDPSTLQQQPGPNLLPGAKGSKVAGIAYMLDSVLKGYMKGREYGEQQKAYKANRLLQGLQFNAQNAAQQYIGFAQTNPEAVSKMFELDKLRSNQNPSPEDQKKILDLSSGKDVQQAQLYRDGSHTARAKMMEMYGNYINPPKKDKGKGKAKGGDQSGEQQNPILMAQSKDPREKSQGVWALASRFDPADIAVRQYASPEYLAQRKLAAGQQQLADKEQQVKSGRADDQIALRNLQMQDPPTDLAKRAEWEQKIDAIQTRLNAGGAVRSSPEVTGSNLIGKADVFGNAITDANKDAHYKFGEIDGKKGWIPVAPKPSAKGKQSWGRDEQGKLYSFFTDPDNHPIPGTEDYQTLPSAEIRQQFQTDTIRTGEFSWKDENNVLHRSQTTAVTTHVPHGKGAGAGAQTAPGTTTPPKGDRTIGSTGPTGQTKSRADAGASIIPLVNKARELMKDPEVANNLGPLAGRWDNLEKRAGNLSGKLRELAGTLVSIYSLGGTMHGWRSIQVAEKFRETYGDLTATPDSLLGGLNAMEFTAKDVYETGYHHPYGQKLDKTGAVPSTT